ncbi:MAG: hypothetical protein JWP03_4104 [Phycisphaerales bacterium]|nr:hypothetical protein [Phycisphaerales bacterium]
MIANGTNLHLGIAKLMSEVRRILSQYFSLFLVRA